MTTAHHQTGEASNDSQLSLRRTDLRVLRSDFAAIAGAPFWQRKSASGFCGRAYNAPHRKHAGFPFPIEHRRAATDRGKADRPPRQVFNCSGFDDPPGDSVRSESDPPATDPAVNQAFDHAGTSWRFYNQIFGRESVDSHGHTLVSSVHYSKNYNNALWNGLQMVYATAMRKSSKISPTRWKSSLTN
jgi:hypothetical protein